MKRPACPTPFFGPKVSESWDTTCDASLLPLIQFSLPVHPTYIYLFIYKYNYQAYPMEDLSPFFHISNIHCLEGKGFFNNREPLRNKSHSLTFLSLFSLLIELWSEGDTIEREWNDSTLHIYIYHGYIRTITRITLFFSLSPFLKALPSHAICHIL